MADQAKVKTDGPPTFRPGAIRTGVSDSRAAGGNGAGPGDVVTSVAEFGENLLTLAELQAELAAIELKQNGEAVKVGGMVVFAGACLALASLPVLLAGIAELLVSELSMKRGYALLSVAVVTLAIAGTCTGVALSRLRRAVIGFPVSREEFTRNLNWVRTVLLHSGRPPRHR